MGDLASKLSNPYNIRLQGLGNSLSQISMKLTLLVTAAAAAMLFSSCNTMIGVGRDMRIGGEGLEKTASKVNGGGADSGDTSGAPVY